MVRTLWSALESKGLEGWENPGRGIKLKNRRVALIKNSLTGEWWLRFKKLEKGKSVKTRLILSDEAMQAVIQLWVELRDPSAD